ncbi:MAG: DUF4932 domain-containing protein [Bacteroidales bacterium]|nr:DUF4932 domain-containing protein [Bacteroidales bacterium]
MKKTFFFTLFCALISLANAQNPLKPEVSETVELMGILSRIAGFEEYCDNVGGIYTADVDAWFAPFREHPAISFFRSLRGPHDIAHERVSDLSIHLSTEGGTVRLLTDRSALMSNWHSVNMDTLIVRLNSFYTETRFHDFFEQHRPFYDEVMRDFEANVLPQFHQDWYARFYGTEAQERFRVVIGFTYGNHNKGCSRQLPGQPREAFSIMGYRLDAASGKAVWDASLLIHEFNHSFVNPLLDNAANVVLMKGIGQKLLLFSLPEMQRQAYGEWPIVINESIVRAAVHVYMIETGQMRSSRALSEEVTHLGFRWMPELITALRHYENYRDKYATLADFYPEIARCLNDYLVNETERILRPMR